MTSANRRGVVEGRPSRRYSGSLIPRGNPDRSAEGLPVSDSTFPTAVPHPTGDHPSSPPTLADTLPPLPRYRRRDEIAHGGMGIVYRADDTALGREVAVKVLADRFGHHPAVARRFADEARIAAQLQHPSVPPVHDLGTLADGRPF